MSISVIIPFYNSEKFIDKTLASIVDQSLRDIEIICINDGSTDETYDKLEEWRLEDERIIVINKTNGGIETALKAALPYLNKKYTFLIGHDDTLSVDALEKAVIEITKKEEYDAVRMKLVLVYDYKRSENFKDKFIVLSGKAAITETIMKWNIHTFCLWKTDIFKQIDKITTGKLMNFDEVATRFLYTKCRKVTFCTGEYYYFQHSNSVTHKFTPRLLDVYAVDFYIKKLLLDSNLYSDFKSDFEIYMFNRLAAMVDLYFNLRKQKHQLSKNEIDKIRLLYSAIDFKFLNKERPLMERLKYGVIYMNFNIYFFYKKRNYEAIPN